MLLVLFQYQFIINFDAGTFIVHQQIIQFLANYILYDSWYDLMVIYLIWLLVSLIPIFIYKNFRKAYSTNLLTFFLPNFFFYVFLNRYSPNYFNSEFLNLMIKSIILCITIIAVSIGLSLIVARLSKKDKPLTEEAFQVIQKETTIICPICGTQFKSIPKYCYNCNSKLINDDRSE
ncbi:MAG: hypothetical protein ACFE8E_12705 [Candidatus Hodarchaeota archaeon]